MTCELLVKYCHSLHLCWQNFCHYVNHYSFALVLISRLWVAGMTVLAITTCHMEKGTELLSWPYSVCRLPAIHSQLRSAQARLGRCGFRDPFFASCYGSCGIYWCSASTASTGLGLEVWRNSKWHRDIPHAPRITSKALPLWHPSWSAVPKTRHQLVQCYSSQMSIISSCGSYWRLQEPLDPRMIFSFQLEENKFNNQFALWFTQIAVWRNKKQ